MMKKMLPVLSVMCVLALVLGVGLIPAEASSSSDDPVGLDQSDEERGFLGIGVEFDEIAGGAVVMQIVEGSPADEAGIEVDDVITAVDGEAVTSAEQLVEKVQTFAPGETITLDVLRDEEEMTFEVTLAAREEFVPDESDAEEEMEDEDDMSPFSTEVRPPSTGEPFPGMPRFQGGDRYQLGVSYRSLTPEISAREGYPVDEGALVLEVVSGSPAEDAGLLPNDIIVAVDDDPIDIERTLSDRLYAYEAQDRVMLSVMRGEEELEIGVVLADEHPARRQGQLFMPGFQAERGPQIFRFNPDEGRFREDFDLEMMPFGQERQGSFGEREGRMMPFAGEDGQMVVCTGEGGFEFVVMLPGNAAELVESLPEMLGERGITCEVIGPMMDDDNE